MIRTIARNGAVGKDIEYEYGVWGRSLDHAGEKSTMELGSPDDKSFLQQIPASTFPYKLERSKTCYGTDKMEQRTMLKMRNKGSNDTKYRVPYSLEIFKPFSFSMIGSWDCLRYW